MLLNIIIGIVISLLIVFIILIRFNTKNIRNGIFGKKIRILLKDANTKEYINSTSKNIRLFYSGEIKNVSSFNKGVTIWIPRNEVSTIIIIKDDKTIKEDKINSGVETEKVIEIKVIDDTSAGNGE